jgi:hypothetical protein
MTRRALAAIAAIVRAAIVLLAVGALARPARAEPAKVQVGAYINDIQTLDLRTHSYVMDLYVWFRWTDPSLAPPPSDTFELMNRFDPEYDARPEPDYAAPLDQPDGAKYQVFRYQGAFSTKLDIRRYPFDAHVLSVSLEDKGRTAQDLVYVADAVSINPDIRLPGYAIGTPRLEIADHPYPTNFGDHRFAAETYSRAAVVIPVTRLGLSGATKTILPIFLVMLGAMASLFLAPWRVEARVGLVASALLTLVALQLAARADLPEVNYLLLLDQIYILSYASVLLVLAIVVASAGRMERLKAKGLARPKHRGPLFALIIAALYALGVAGIMAA